MRSLQTWAEITLMTSSGVIFPVISLRWLYTTVKWNYYSLFTIFFFLYIYIYTLPPSQPIRSSHIVLLVTSRRADMRSFSQQAVPIYSTSDMSGGSFRVLELSTHKVAHTLIKETSLIFHSVLRFQAADDHNIVRMLQFGRRRVLGGFFVCVLQTSFGFGVCEI